MDKLFGIRIGVPSLKEAVNRALDTIESRNKQVVFACANSHSMKVARTDEKFRLALVDADQLVADGVGVSLVARLAGKDVGPRIIGHQYFEALLDTLKNRGHGRIFFFGSSETALALIRERFALRYPELTLCGTISPPFGDWSEQQNNTFIDSINSANPDVLWVGMTAPKQEKWVHRNRQRLTAPVIGSIGAVFDFFAGTVKPSPAWIRRCGLESMYRLGKEPRRMWSRVLSSMVFMRIGIWNEVLGFGRDGQS